MSVSEQDELLLNAYLDGELAPIEAARFEQRLAKEAGLTAQVEARHALRDSMRSGLAESARLDPGRDPGPPWRHRFWRAPCLAARSFPAP